MTGYCGLKSKASLRPTRGSSSLYVLLAAEIASDNWLLKRDWEARLDVASGFVVSSFWSMMGFVM